MSQQGWDDNEMLDEMSGSCIVHEPKLSPERVRAMDKIKTLWKPRIFKVDDLLRKVNEKAYEPVMLAIGPYHRGKIHLEMMEAHKLQYLQLFLLRRDVSSEDKYDDDTYDVDTYVRKLSEKLSQKKNEIRIFYGSPTTPYENELLEMMVIDGCFIIELLRKFGKKGLVYEDDLNDPIFQKKWMLSFLKRDLLLFENQLPFFILIELFNMTKLPNSQDDLVDRALNFLGNKLPNPCCRKPMSSYKPDHLLGLIHHSWSPFHGGPNVAHEEDEGPFIRCTIKLQRLGIRFEKATESPRLFDIKFEADGVMKIPPLKVNDEVEWLFRNLIAYEQYHQTLPQRYVTDYAIFMDCLVDTAKDVEQLSDYGIIENRLGSDELLSDMFNKLCLNVSIIPRSFCYSQVFKEVNQYSAAKYRRAYGELRYQYRSGYARLSDPMTFLNLQISMIAILLAVIQIVIPFCTNS